MKFHFEKIKDFYKKTKRENSFIFYSSHFILAFLVLAGLLYFFFFRAPSNFPERIIFTIEKGRTLSQVSEKLKSENFIKSSFWTRNSIILIKGENSIKAGDYYFENPENAFKIAKRITKGDFGLAPVLTTIPEGLNIFEIANLLESKFTKFNKEKFIELAQEKEGYLFPDTYYFLANAREEDFIEIMEENFKEKIDSIKDKVKKFDKSLEEIVVVASILENEARTRESRETIAGIIWKRLEIGMPLQVDVSFKYVNGKNTYELTSEDLKVDSPYNTYLYRGLPPTPISNPGLDSILTAINPKESDYLYFLSDKSGNMYYAVTHDEHVDNKRLYLHN